MDELTTSERQLLARLKQAQGRIVSRAVLEISAWGIWDTVTPGSLDAAMRNIQSKLSSPGSNVMITGSAGHGYALSRGA